MTEPKFTQGPWKRVYDDYNEEYVIMDSSGEFAITYVHDWGGSPIIGDCPIEANARLIVTAPEMYALLKKHQAECGGSSNYGSCSACRDRESCELTSLLARVDGEESK